MTFSTPHRPAPALRGFFEDSQTVVIWSQSRYPILAQNDPDECDAFYYERMFEACR
jgi:hypothetical protein